MQQQKTIIFHNKVIGNFSISVTGLIKRPGSDLKGARFNLRFLSVENREGVCFTTAYTAENI